MRVKNGVTPLVGSYMFKLKSIRMRGVQNKTKCKQNHIHRDTGVCVHTCMSVCVELHVFPGSVLWKAKKQNPLQQYWAHLEPCSFSALKVTLRQSLTQSHGRVCVEDTQKYHLRSFVNTSILGHWSTNCISGPTTTTTKYRPSTMESFQPKTTQKMWIDFLPASTDQSKAEWLKGIRFWKQFHFYVEKVQVMLLSKEGKERFPKTIRAEVQGMLSSQHRPRTYLGTWFTVSPEIPCCWAGWHGWSGLRGRKRAGRKSSGLGSVTN